jgi:hypothetical protein
VEFEFTEWIDRPPHEVYGFLRDIEYHAGREGSVVPVYDKITAGPVGVGSRYREVVRVLPFVRWEVTSEITDLEPGQKLAYLFSGVGMRGRLVYEFATEGSGTRVTQRQVLNPQGALKLCSPLIRPLFSVAGARRLRHIKGVLEQPAAAD